MKDKRFVVRKSGDGLFYADGDYSIDNTTQFVIEIVEYKLNELYEDMQHELSVSKALRDVVKELEKQNKLLKQENQEYKAILQDIGLLRSDEEVICIRNEIADKLIKPLFESEGFDVDIDTADGFTIIPPKR